mmetsp:Transcript_9623/g.28273  ORF Transcript_9623/g.28273 Transcript_9623/m.28273 type:complete len:231 (-) Transcript_9623:50-742(-)
MLKLLGRGVVLVVLVAPPGAAHAAADAVDGDLEHAVGGDVAGHGVVATLVHEPAAAALGEAKDHEAEGLHAHALIGHENVRAEKVHGDDLGRAVDALGHARLEEALLLELLAKRSVVLAQAGLAVALAARQDVGRRRAAREAGEHLVGGSAAHVELAVGLRGIAIARQELDDGATRVLEAAHIVEAAINEHLGVIELRDGVAGRRSGVGTLAHAGGLLRLIRRRSATSAL